MLEGKRVLIISPQPWKHIPVSKHNYARVLAKRENIVYFLNPIRYAFEARQKRGVVPTAVHGIFEVSVSFPMPRVLRFHARSVHDAVVQRLVLRLFQLIDGPPDVTWSFDPNTFSDLRVFKSEVRIYHIVDPINDPSHVWQATSATVTLASDPQFLKPIEASGIQGHFINHGVSAPFEELGEEVVGQVHPLQTVGYAGNLLRPEVDFDALVKMAQAHPSLTFHFYGPSEEQESPYSVEPEVSEGLERLRELANVNLHGAVAPAILARALSRHSLLLTAYKNEAKGALPFNPHKVLEYLATGRPVVANVFAPYVDIGDLLMVPSDGRSCNLPEAFARIVQEYAYWDSRAMRQARRAYAMNNTYALQLQRIETLLSAVLDRQE